VEILVLRHEVAILRRHTYTYEGGHYLTVIRLPRRRPHRQDRRLVVTEGRVLISTIDLANWTAQRGYTA
jgi:hypothetical protein